MFVYLFDLLRRKMKYHTIICIEGAPRVNRHIDLFNSLKGIFIPWKCRTVLKLLIFSRRICFYLFIDRRFLLLSRMRDSVTLHLSARSLCCHEGAYSLRSKIRRRLWSKHRYQILVVGITTLVPPFALCCLIPINLWARSYKYSRCFLLALHRFISHQV